MFRIIKIKIDFNWIKANNGVSADQDVDSLSDQQGRSHWEGGDTHTPQSKPLSDRHTPVFHSSVSWQQAAASSLSAGEEKHKTSVRRSGILQTDDSWSFASLEPGAAVTNLELPLLRREFGRRLRRV